MKHRIIKITTWLSIALISALITYKLHFHIINTKNSVVNFLSNSRVKENNKLDVILPNKLFIEIKSDNYDKLLNLREEALKRGNIGPKQKKKIKAKVKFNNKEFKAKVRLKGDNCDHLVNEKFSLKINESNNNKYSIQHPQTRSYLYEWVLHKALLKCSIPTTKYDFIDVTINKKYKGIYAIENGFDNTFFEENNIKKGPVLKFDEDIVWKEGVLQELYVSKQGFNTIGSYVNCSILNYKIGFKNEDSITKVAIDKLDSFRHNKEKDLSIYFELKTLAKYFAILELFGANHGARWHNIRFYYDIKTKKFMPVGYDGSEISETSLLHDAFDDSPDEKINEGYLQMFFTNYDFMKYYVEEINNLINNNFMFSLFKDIQQEYDFLEKELCKEFTFEMDLNEKLEKRIKYLKTVYYPYHSLFPYLKNKSKILVGNGYFIPIELLSIKVDDNKIKLGNFILKPKSRRSPMMLIELPIEIDSLEEKRAEVIYKHLGNDSIYNERIVDFYNAK